MQPPKCPHCGKVEWQHLCGGQAQSEIGRRFEHARGGGFAKSRNKLPSFVTKPVTRPVIGPREVPRSVPQSTVTAMKAEIEALQAEVAQLKRQLAKSNAALSNQSNQSNELSNAKSNVAGFDKKAYQRELMRKRRAAKKTGEQQFEG